MSRNHDLIVIGSGSGGIAMANRAASYGASVALIESGRLVTRSGLGSRVLSSDFNFWRRPRRTYDLSLVTHH